MDGQQFLEEFGHIANAPNGVAKLRELVLRIAIQGRLVTQNPSEEPASKFLSRMPVPDRKVQRRFRAARGGHDGAFLSLPNGWETVQLHRIAFPQAGFAFTANLFNQSKQGLPIIRVRDVGANNPQTYFSGEYRDEFLVDRDEWLVAMDGDFRVAKWESEQSLLNQRVSRLRFFSNEIEKKYVAIALQFELRKLQGVRNYTTVDHLSGSQISDAIISLPPIAEQARIVAKVEELIALCNRLDHQHQDRRIMQNALRQSTLEAVASAPSPQELRDGWERLEANFGRLFSEVSDIEALRKALTDLAVSGLLSKRNSDDESAQELKKRILSAKERGISMGQFSRKKNVKMELLKETPLPKHWETISLDDAISTIDAGWSPACLPRARENDSKWGVLKTTAVQVLRFLPEEHKELPAALEPRPQYQIGVGDILITRAGPKNRVGICCVVDAAPKRLMISDKLIRIHIVDDLIDPNFVALCLSAGEAGRNIEKLMSGMADSQMNISQNKLRSIEIPLPPFSEQRRILEALDGFMKTLDEYAEGLKKVARLGQQLSKAAIESITGISIKQEEDSSVKAPQTELVSKLRLSTSPGVKVQAPLATILARHDGELSARDLWQRFGGEIDAFYAQLKTEVAHGWVAEPAVAEMLERTSEAAGA